MSEATGEKWAILELLGHRIRRGRVSEVEVAGAKMVQIQEPVLDDDGNPTGEYSRAERYSAAAIYGLHDSTKEEVIEYVRRMHPSSYRVPQLEPGDDDGSDSPMPWLDHDASCTCDNCQDELVF